jgi:hypothetical protein
MGFLVYKHLATLALISTSTYLNNHLLSKKIFELWKNKMLAGPGRELILDLCFFRHSSPKSNTSAIPPTTRWRREIWQGCQIFLSTKYQNWKIYTKLPWTITNSHKIYQMAVQYTKWPWNIGTNIFHCKTLKIYPNWHFWFENIPSGNPGLAKRKSPFGSGWKYLYSIYLTKRMLWTLDFRFC